MDLLEFKKKSPRGATDKTSSFKFARLAQFAPRGHIILVGVLSASLAIVASLPSEPAQASRQTVELPIPRLQEATTEEVAAGIQETATATLIHNTDTHIIEETVRSGDSLSSIFARAGLNDKIMFKLVNAIPEAKSLSKIFPGQKFTFALDQEKQLVSLHRSIDRLHSESFTLNEENSFSYQNHTKAPDVKLAIRSGQISSSLYIAGKDAGLDEELIMEMAAIFGWDVDFALDIRKGDSFRLVYEEKFLDGERIGAGNILAAEFVNQNNTFKAVRYVDESGKAQFYSPDGKAMQKAFLRAPLDFRRISSNFNPKRLHPVTKRVKPHRGTDYAANRGTPVWASGDGKVIASGFTSANGNYIVIQHGGDIQTKYLHLHKRKVKKGDRVKQQQIIGTVGTTGLSTAPHLHYEFLVNGVHRNPRTIVQKLPKAKSIPSGEMARFLNQTQPVLAQLGTNTRIAAVEKDRKSL